MTPEECLARHQEEVRKLNTMSYKEATAYCEKVKESKGDIAAREIWKSSKHWRKNELR